MNYQQERLIFRLKEGELSLNRFLKVGSNKPIPTHKHPEGELCDKAAFETDFQNNLYGPEALDTYPRWGICGKDFLVLLDFDKQGIYDIISKLLPPTFEVTSPRHGLPHRYYIVCGQQVPNLKFHVSGDVDEKGHKKPSGEIRADNHYLVAPGTTIRYEDLKTGQWTTGEYKITNDVPIARLEFADFMNAVKPYLLDKIGERILTNDKIENGVSTGERHDTIFRYACRLVGDNPEGRFPASIALEMLRRYNEKLSDPVEDDFCIRVIREGCEYSAKETGVPASTIAELGFKVINERTQQGENFEAKTEPIIPGDIKKVTYAEAPSLLAQGYKVTKKYAETLVVEKKAVGSEQTNDDKPIESQADRLIKYCLAENPDIFFDQHKNGFVRVKLAFPLRHYGICGIPITLGEDENKEEEEKREASPKLLETSQTSQCRNLNEQKHNVIMPMGSQQFKKWLSYLMYLKEQKAPGNDSLNSAINVLGGKAQAEGMQYTLYNRVAPAIDGFYIDMADDRNRAIHVTAKGWEVVNDYPILFKHYSHQQPLAEPLEKEKEKGNAWKLLDYINIKADDKSSRLALLCSVISYFIPLIAHPAIVVSGTQGTCKSWFFSLIRKVIDPSSIELLTVPTDEKAMAQHCEHNWLVPYDNITYLPGWGSDMLCRAITGGGISVRKLYTDDEDIILNFKRCVMLNGINIAALKGDLLDRTFPFTLEPIAQKSRRTEKDLNVAFEKDRALIFTGFLNVLSKALEYYPDIKLEEVQRLSDFNFYGCAIAKALGKNPEDFIIAYRDMVAAQNEEALNNNLVAVAILKFAEIYIKRIEKMDATAKMVTEAYWKDQPLVLFNNLKEIANFTLGIDIKTNKEWPKTPSALSRKINAISANLKAVGIEIVNYKGNPRRISIDAKNYIIPPKPKTPEGEPAEKKYCADECRNFGSRVCPAPDSLKRSESAEVPFQCPLLEAP